MNLRSTLFAVLLTMSTSCIIAQSIGINNSSPDTSAILDVSSSNKGLLIPRMTESQRDNIADPAESLMIYQTDKNPGYYYYDGNAWRGFGDATDNVMSNMQVGSSDSSSIPEYILGEVGMGDFLLDSTGIIYDSGGPDGNYASNEDTATFIAPPAFAVGVRFTVLSFSTESPYDSVVIFAVGQTRVSLSGEYDEFTLPLMGSYVNYIQFSFKSNGVNNQAGFKIRWDWIFPTTTDTLDAPEAGWYFSPQKMAMRGGTNTGNAWDADSLGNFSVAYGMRAMATGYHSVALGPWARSSGEAAISSGSSTASDQFATSLGKENKAYGDYAIALGAFCEAGQRAMAMGYKNISSGIGSFASGYYTNASGKSAVAEGYKTVASGDYALASGYFSNATGEGSTALGYATIAHGKAMHAVGLFNDPVVAEGSPLTENSPIFIVGNGDQIVRKNAMVVLQNGRVGIGTNNPGNLLHVGTTTGDGIRIGSYEAITDLGPTQIGANAGIFPTSDNLYDLGSSSNRWDDIWATNGVIQTSDARDKEDITDLDYGLEKLLALRPVSYHWKEGNNKDKQLGLLAQELLEIVPEVVRSTNTVYHEDGTFTEEETERLGVNYAALTPILINAIQEINAINEGLTSDIDDQSRRIKKLEEENRSLRNALESRIAALELKLED